MCGKKIRRKLVPQKKKSCGEAGLKKNSFTEKFSPPLQLFLVVRPQVGKTIVMFSRRRVRSQ